MARSIVATLVLSNVLRAPTPFRKEAVEVDTTDNALANVLFAEPLTTSVFIAD